MLLRLAACLLLVAGFARAAEIKGRVTNAVGGEPLERVQVLILETHATTTTSSSGEFTITGLPPGNYTLRLNAVSFRLSKVPFTLTTADESKEFEIALVPDNFHHTDKVEVTGDIFHREDSPATSEINLTSGEIRQTSTVFADDPFRAVQTLPGVSAEGNNEFFAEFSVLGSPFSRTSIYVDDVLVPNPFHEIGNFSEGASLGILTSEVVEDMKLLPAAYPQKFGDAIGAALDIHTREGSRGRPLFRLSAGIAASEFLAEGGLGKSEKGSWLVSARKSYINYLIRGRVQDAAEVGFSDGDLKLNYDLTPKQNLSFYATGGHTDMNIANSNSLAINDYASGKSDFGMARLGWRWSVTPRLLVSARGAYVREPDELRNVFGQILNTTGFAQWVGGGGVTWNWASDSVLDAGWTERRVRNTSSFGYYDPDTGQAQASQFAGGTLRQSGYAQNASSFLKGRVHVLGSLRWDRQLPVLPKLFSPQISMAIRLASATELQLGAGRYTQYSDDLNTPATGTCIPEGFLPPRSDHYTAAIEQRFGENTRVRVELFERTASYVLGFIPPSEVNSNPCPDLQPLPGGLFSATTLAAHS